MEEEENSEKSRAKALGCRKVGRALEIQSTLDVKRPTYPDGEYPHEQGDGGGWNEKT